MKYKLFGLLRRIGLLILVVWTVVTLVTLLIELVPGDPAVAVRDGNGDYHALNDRCTHADVSLSEGVSALKTVPEDLWRKVEAIVTGP